ncbi:MAG: Sulfurtransferase TusA [Alphaproteobacteria bacterium MarineAlpha5_Bin9]|nr:MAG: Sulfurtransferase TusA [Alphaproteobacteria bacterium MarineAlpha5_Bin9]|tara:strand:- start:3334 stop:3579 length:246 start_codon:yes stop_codon:yes gene_type:complete
MKSSIKKNEIDLDVRGLECPLPVLKARKLSQSLKKGTIVKVICTDPLAKMDFEHYCEESGNIFIGCEKIKENYIIRYKYIK